MGRANETCALCHKELSARDQDASATRQAHLEIEGAGQLCEECYQELTHNKAWHNLA